jgi:hypothetical protein
VCRPLNVANARANGLRPSKLLLHSFNQHCQPGMPNTTGLQPDIAH